ncbi:hypothetical protein HQ576_06370 [bacterium]|nr:hypothetical protein [bacterium]
MTRRKRRWLVIALVLATLAAIQTVTYVLFAEAAMPVACLRQLRDTALLDGRYAWVPHSTWDTLTHAQQEALTRYLKQRYDTIHHTEDAIPEAGKHYVPITQRDIEKYERGAGPRNTDSAREVYEARRRAIEAGRKLAELRDGVKLEWRLRGRGPFWMECQPMSWVSGTGAELREDIHIWLFGWWVKVWNCGRAVS